jgi:hypothetical protein
VATVPRYNERAWAIDVISEINIYLSSRKLPIARAGGEHSLSDSSGSLFPDVLLFGDSEDSIVQQGWELKMPDTSIIDIEFLSNAEKKARRLGLCSFVVWNANESAIYVKNSTDSFEHYKSWDCTGLTRRQDVVRNRPAWVKLLHEMIDDINALILSGFIHGSRPAVVISDTLFLDYLNTYTGPLATELMQACRKSAAFHAKVKDWWLVNEIEHPESDEFHGLARVNIVCWLNRFLFAHYLKRFFSKAKIVESLITDTDVNYAISVFEAISKSCDFMNIFRPEPGQKHVDSETWSALIRLNTFLNDFRLDSISQESFQQILDGALNYSRKKMAGQFSTPRALAELLVGITVEDRTKPLIDPCCGTGTIPRAAYEQKRKVGLSVSEALSSVWGSDKFTFPLQLSSIALSDPLGIGEVVQIFQRDAFELRPGNVISFTNPTSGKDEKRKLPLMHAAVSNLPFVRFEDKNVLNPLINCCIEELKAEVGNKAKMGGKADLYAYLLFQIRHLIEDTGRIGVITSNSWLGTDWGKAFRDMLNHYFKILRVVISGSGRWFSNSDVVTTILVLEKNRSNSQSDFKTDFITINSKIEEWNTDKITISILSNSKTNITSLPISKHSYNKQQISTFEDVGIGWPALFVDLDWVSALKDMLTPVNTLFNINRGERRGWDALFYPNTGHRIEPEYIKPVLLSSRDIQGLIAYADRDAFCCSNSISDLKITGKKGALRWIRLFETINNTSGSPLTEVLKRSNHYWYEMKPDTLADFVISMNPDKRLFVAKLDKRSFVNQRLIRFSVKANCDVNVDLVHALLNSIVGLFLLESAGFGRGLAALDLNATKLSKSLHVINPALLSRKSISMIMKTFRPLTKRKIEELPNELGNSDRQCFDKAVLRALGLEDRIDDIYRAFLNLYNIRQAVRN